MLVEERQTDRQTDREERDSKRGEREEERTEVEESKVTLSYFSRAHFVSSSSLFPLSTSPSLILTQKYRQEQLPQFQEEDL